MHPKSGRLLISDPFLMDPNFKRTVILLCEHEREGTLGFVLNKPLDLTLADAVPELDNFIGTLYYGGPVQTDTLHFIHTRGDLIEDSVELMDGLFWGGNFELLKILIETDQIEEEDFRFFMGYSGWGPGQLRDEIDSKSWLVTEANQEHVFIEDTYELWRSVIQTERSDYAAISNFPENPSLN
ncbi:MAG: YqgE/AlgH family protein [Bacteroidetes bacterium]|nr:YqgE/AlgH family protein [Bacteroidota bacterium]